MCGRGQIGPKADIHLKGPTRCKRILWALQRRTTNMPDSVDAVLEAARREPWNKGKLIGAKPPLQPKHVWSIRSELQIAGRTRDLAMFNPVLCFRNNVPMGMTLHR